MAMKKYRFVGLDKDVWLPDNIVVEIAIVPASTRNIRSNEWFVGQTSYTQHETANFNWGANVDMHKNWLHNGAGGEYVGFNFVVDDKKIIQLTPLNEVTWAAGTPDGNRYSYHTELCVNADINHDVARRNAAALAGGIMAAKGWGINRLYQHNIWWGKDCPYLLRREGRWALYVAQADAFRKEAQSGGTTAPVPVPQPAPAPAPVIFDGTKTVTINGIVFNANKRTVTSIGVNEREWASTDSPVRKLHLYGAKIAVLGWIKGADVGGENRWWVTNPDGGRIWVGGTIEKP